MSAVVEDVIDWHAHLTIRKYTDADTAYLESIGIASMISWHGVWYVVHFGGVQRTGGGMIFEPAAGEGTAGPPGGC